jgi:hypothetical protein
MTLQRARLRRLTAIIAFWACGAFAAETDVNAYIAKAPVAGVPTAPYGQWTDEQKKNAFKRLAGFCQFLCVDSHAHNYFSEQAAAIATAEAKTCLDACMVNHLPQDFPRYADLQAQLKSDYTKARQLGSTIPWPLQGQ